MPKFIVRFVSALLIPGFVWGSTFPTRDLLTQIGTRQYSLRIVTPAFTEQALIARVLEFIHPLDEHPTHPKVRQVLQPLAGHILLKADAPASLAFWIVLAWTGDIYKAIKGGRRWLGGYGLERLVGVIGGTVLAIVSPTLWWIPLVFWGLHLLLETLIALGWTRAPPSLGRNALRPRAFQIQGLLLGAYGIPALIVRLLYHPHSFSFSMLLLASVVFLTGVALLQGTYDEVHFDRELNGSTIHKLLDCMELRTLDSVIENHKNNAVKMAAAAALDDWITEYLQETFPSLFESSHPAPSLDLLEKIAALTESIYRLFILDYRGEQSLPRDVRALLEKEFRGELPESLFDFLSNVVIQYDILYSYLFNLAVDHFESHTPFDVDDEAKKLIEKFGLKSIVAHNTMVELQTELFPGEDQHAIGVRLVHPKDRTSIARVFLKDNFYDHRASNESLYEKWQSAIRNEWLPAFRSALNHTLQLSPQHSKEFLQFFKRFNIIFYEGGNLIAYFKTSGSQGKSRPAYAFNHILFKSLAVFVHLVVPHETVHAVLMDQEPALQEVTALFRDVKRIFRLHFAPTEADREAIARAVGHPLHPTAPLGTVSAQIMGELKKLEAPEELRGRRGRMGPSMAAIHEHSLYSFFTGFISDAQRAGEILSDDVIVSRILSYLLEDRDIYRHERSVIKSSSWDEKEWVKRVHEASSLFEKRLKKIQEGKKLKLKAYNTHFRRHAFPVSEHNLQTVA
jgi:hypothetical protein